MLGGTTQEEPEKLAQAVPPTPPPGNLDGAMKVETKKLARVVPLTLHPFEATPPSPAGNAFGRVETELARLDVDAATQEWEDSANKEVANKKMKHAAGELPNYQCLNCA